MDQMFWKPEGPIMPGMRGLVAKSVMQIPESGRQIIYGVVILAMLLAYGRSSRIAG